MIGFTDRYAGPTSFTQLLVAVVEIIITLLLSPAEIAAAFTLFCRTPVLFPQAGVCGTPFWVAQAAVVKRQLI